MLIESHKVTYGGGGDGNCANADTNKFEGKQYRKHCDNNRATK